MKTIKINWLPSAAALLLVMVCSISGSLFGQNSGVCYFETNRHDFKALEGSCLCWHDEHLYEKVINDQFSIASCKANLIKINANALTCIAADYYYWCHEYDSADICPLVKTCQDTFNLIHNDPVAAGWFKRY